MIGNESIDLSLKNIWQSWFEFRRGKRAGIEMHTFQYYLERNLYELFEDLNAGKYVHGGYRKFVVNDNKRREISVAMIRDRVVHRLIYEYLEKIYNKTFIYDVWSCRRGKGLTGAVERIGDFLVHGAHPYGRPFIGVWKCDVKKFFDNVDQEVLLEILSFRIKDSRTFNLIKEVVKNYTAIPGKKVGMPIGNLTSQIFANIYFNELDRFVKYKLKPEAFLRYGDDFILVESDLEKLKFFRIQTVNFLNNRLKLQANNKSDKIVRMSHGLKILGMKFWPSGVILNARSLSRSSVRLKQNNVSSYSGMIKKHGAEKQIKEFSWMVLALIRT